MLCCSFLQSKVQCHGGGRGNRFTFFLSLSREVVMDNRSTSRSKKSAAILASGLDKGGFGFIMS